MNRLNPLNDFLFKKLFGDENDSQLLIGLLNIKGGPTDGCN
jgi:hypothetical protein